MRIGCNNGREALSALALGARTVLGIDQPEASLAQAAQLNAVAKTKARFLRAPAGLRIERLEEFPRSNREAEYGRHESHPAQLPLCYTLVARKPAP